MTTIRIIVTLKPGVLDAQGQAGQQGLRALGYESVGGVRVGKCIELAVPDEVPPETREADCDSCLADVRRGEVVVARVGGAGLGISNGFQILLEAGLLPGAMLRNAVLRFRCTTVHVRVESTQTPFTRTLRDGQALRMPIAHGEGN